MNYPYFPGCTLYTKAQSFDEAAKRAGDKLGFALEELPYWTCCGATFPLAEDYDMALASPTRVLARARQQGEKVVTLCAVCHNVLKRTNHVMKTNEARRAKVTDFIQEPYDGTLDVVHYLEVLRDDVGFEGVAAKVEKSLQGLKVAPFYGCLLLRPKAEMAMDDPDNPRIFEDLLRALGAEPVDFPMKAECCGAFQVVHSDDMATRCSREIIGSAKKRGAELLVTACPLCQFNLEDRQAEMAKAEQGFKGLPVLYFTQLLALALGDSAEGMDVSRHHADPRPVLQAHGL
ncbi:MAG: CoB--CoM heterodisulfide reductase iron-sulfur subunit B family protein [Deltaproteobacteria bacterium]|nr:CoB--CoM heterodisulfide reductase iron-sulfur subunit B family protein [Deltaproteobacteria bacterium]